MTDEVETLFCHFNPMTVLHWANDLQGLRQEGMGMDNNFSVLLMYMLIIKFGPSAPYQMVLLLNTWCLNCNCADKTSNLMWFVCLYVYIFRLLIKNGNNIDSPPVYDSYEVEYLPNEGVLSTGRYLFVEFTTDGTLTSTGAAIRYEGRRKINK